MGDERVREIRARLDAAKRAIRANPMRTHPTKAERTMREAAFDDVEYLLAKVERLRVAVRERDDVIQSVLVQELRNAVRDGLMEEMEDPDALASMLMEAYHYSVAWRKEAKQ